jgi:hypothetical protein
MNQEPHRFKNREKKDMGGKSLRNQCDRGNPGRGIAKCCAERRARWRGVECTSNYDLYSIMQFADRINDRLFYRLYEHQQRPYLACRSRNTEPHKTGVSRHSLFLATNDWLTNRRDG